MGRTGELRQQIICKIAKKLDMITFSEEIGAGANVLASFPCLCNRKGLGMNLRTHGLALRVALRVAFSGLKSQGQSPTGPTTCAGPAAAILPRWR